MLNEKIGTKLSNEKNLLMELLVSGKKLTDYTGSYAKVYQSATEVIKDYYRHFDFAGKRVVVPTSSGDHILNANYKGANDITAFDVNPLAEHYVRLRIAAINAIDFADFQGFFIGMNEKDNRVFSSSLYDGIREYLVEGHSKEFWDEAYKICREHGIGEKAIFDALIMGKAGNLAAFNKVNAYTTTKGYKELRKRIKDSEIKFETTDIMDLPQVLKGEYGIFVFSNILPHLSQQRGRNAGPELRDLVINRLGPHLADKGSIIAAYYNFYLSRYASSVLGASHGQYDLAGNDMKTITVEPFFDVEDLPLIVKSGQIKMGDIFKTRPDLRGQVTDAIVVYTKK